MLRDEGLKNWSCEKRYVGHAKHEFWAALHGFYRCGGLKEKDPAVSSHLSSQSFGEGVHLRKCPFPSVLSCEQELIAAP